MLARRVRSALAITALACAPSARAFLIPPGPSSVAVVEYFNELTGHYLLVADSDEMTRIDQSAAGPGWRRTGHRFGESWTGPDPRNASVCRFYSPANNSHFFTADPVECGSLRERDTGWIYEKVAFRTVAPAEGACREGRKPIYRLYNNRHAVGDANHRFVFFPGLRDQMVAQGWIAEGIAFCANTTGTEPDARFEVGQEWSGEVVAATPSGCDARAGTCFAVQNLPALARVVGPWEPPDYITRNPSYPRDIQAVTGMADLDIRTGLPPGSPDLVAHSFLQAGAGRLPVALHVNGADRLQGPWASVSPMFTLPRAASTDGDGRVYPWRHRGESTVAIIATVEVKSVRRADPAAHAYGGPVLHVVDKSSGRGFWMAMQVFSTLAPGDGVGHDATTGTPTVGTAFRSQPAFGRLLPGSGQFVRCVPEVVAACAPASTFAFLVGKADFVRALEIVRAVEPSLPSDPAAYYLSSFRFHAETYLDASLVAVVHRMAVEIWP